MQFTICGQKFEITAEDIRKKMHGVEPDAVATLAVSIEGKLYPVKQVISLVTGLPKADFNSHQARHVLRRLGLELGTEKKGRKK